MDTTTYQEIIDGILENRNKLVPVIGEKIIYHRTAEGGRESFQTFVVKKMMEEKGASPGPDELQKMTETGYYGMSLLYKENQKKFKFRLRKIYKENLGDFFLEPYIADFLKALRPNMVITTFPFPLIQQLLKDDLADYETRVFDGSSNELLKREIPEDSRIIFHLFGLNKEDNSTCVNTETDLIRFLHWLHDKNTSPTGVSNYLIDKELVFLGCNLPDWLFRFLWFSIGKSDAYYKQTAGSLQVDSDTSGYWMDGKKDISPALHDFLDDIQYESPDSVQAILEEVTRKINEENSLTDGKQYEYDFFLSFTGLDADLCKKVAETLSEKGYSVWSSPRTINVGDNYARVISDDFPLCRIFMPLVTTNYLHRMTEATSRAGGFANLKYDAIDSVVAEAVYASQHQMDSAPIIEQGTTLFGREVTFRLLEEKAEEDTLPRNLFKHMQMVMFSVSSEGKVEFDTPIKISDRIKH